MTHPNAATILEAIAAQARGDMETFLGTVNDDVIAHFPGRSPVAGDHHGKAGVLAMFQGMVELAQGTMRNTPRDVIAGDRYAAGIYDMSASRNGHELRWQLVNVYRFEGGKVSEVWLQPQDQYAFDSFFAGAAEEVD